MQRFFLMQPLADEMTINGGDAHHLGRVLRARPGDRLTVADPKGQTAIVRIVKITPEQVVLALEQRMLQQSEPPVRLWLAQGMPKADKMELVIQKAVELGVYGIIPMQTDNTVVRYETSKAQAKIERWQKIAAEAAKQCGRQQIPVIKKIYSLEQVLDSFASGMPAVMPYENEAAQTLGEVLAQPPQELLVMIGPEGGFSVDEAHLCRQQGVKTVTLGPRILRAETAALAAISIIMYQCGDMGGNKLYRKGEC